MTKAGIMKTVSLKGKEKFLRLGVERYTAFFDIAKKIFVLYDYCFA